MKIIPDVHDYFMVKTFMFRGNLAKEGSFDNNNIVNGRNLGLNFEIHFKTNNHIIDLLFKAIFKIIKGK